MALQITTNINVDFYDNKYIMINAKQYDDRSRLISVTCYNEGSLYNLSAKNHTAYVKYRKANGRWVLNSCAINNKGLILIELTEQMLASAGICYVDLIIVNKGSAIVNIDTGSITTIDGSSVLTTKAFCIDVQEAVVDNSLIESSDEYSGLTDLLERAEADYADVIQDAKSWAVGTGNNARENDEQDNSKYYSKLSRSYAVGDAGGVRTNENKDNSKYYSEQARASADSADESEANAKTSEQNAKTSETNAKTSETNAYNYSIVSQRYAVGGTGTDGEDTDNAMYYSKLSKSYAVGNADGVRDDEDTENAKIYMDKALDYATTSQRYAVGDTGTDGEEIDNAKYYYEQAAISEDNARSHMNNANTYMSDAKKYSTLSQRYAVGGTGTVDGEDKDNAQYYCNKALESASNIAGDADVISNAAELASNSAKAAENSANEADASAGLASDNAEAAAGSASLASDSANAASNSANAAAGSEANAHTYYLQVEEITTGLSGAFMPMGTIEFAELATLIENGEVKAGHLYNISDNFTTDDTFKRGAGIEYAAGTNVYYTSEGYWDCLVGTTVTGVKGENETEYRKGNVNITAENIGAVSSVDVATVDEIKSYLGI